MSQQTRSGLASIASDSGVFSIVAMDQRNTLRKMFQAVGIEASMQEMMDTKAAAVKALSPYASAFLLDPTIGIPAIAGGELDPQCGLLVAAEPEKRGKFNGEPITHRDPELNAEWVKKQGGTAMKFLVQLRVDRVNDPNGPDIAAEVLRVVKELVEDCRQAGIPSVVENLIYPLPGEELDDDKRGDAIIEAARALNDLRPDLLKLEYPRSAKNTKKLAEVLDVPWAVLSAGVSFDQFEHVLDISFGEGGASGFIAGRSIWKEIVGMEGEQQKDFLKDVSVGRLEKLVARAEKHARPWTEVL